MSEPIKTKIPAEMEPAAVGGMVTDAKYIIDRVKNKNQTEINTEVGTEITNIKGGSSKSIANLDSQINGNGGIDERLGTVEELAEISIGGGDAQIATGEDFHNPTAEQRAKVPTVGAILDGADDEPTAGSDNLVKSGGIYNELKNSKSIISTNHNSVLISSIINGNENRTYQNLFSADSVVLTYPDTLQYIYLYTDIEKPEAGKKISVSATDSFRCVVSKKVYGGTSYTNIFESYTYPCTFVVPNDAEIIRVGIACSAGVTQTTLSDIKIQYISNVDKTPIENSPNFVESGGVFSTAVALSRAVMHTNHYGVTLTEAVGENLKREKGQLYSVQELTINYGSLGYAYAYIDISSPLVNSVIGIVGNLEDTGKFNVVIAKKEYGSDTFVTQVPLTEYSSEFLYTIPNNTEILRIGFSGIVDGQTSSTYRDIHVRYVSVDNIDEFKIPEIFVENLKPSDFEQGSVDFSDSHIRYTNYYNRIRIKKANMIHLPKGVTLFSPLQVRYYWTDLFGVDYDCGAWITNDNYTTTQEGYYCIQVKEEYTASMVETFLNGFKIYKEGAINQRMLELEDSLKDEKTGILDFYPQAVMLPIFENYKFRDTDSDGFPDPSYQTLSLLWFSDVHAFTDTLERVITLAEHYSQYIDDIVFTGDAVLNNWSNGFDFWSQKNANKVLFTIGNHDTWGDIANITGTAYSAKACYDRYIAPFILNTGIQYVADKCYWYKDYPEAKIRLISIDIYHWKETIDWTDESTSTIYPDGGSVDTGEQATWFASKLAEAKSLGYGVICSAHAPQYGAININCTFQTLRPTQGGGLLSEPIQMVQDFIDDGGEYICWIAGHNHKDKFQILNGYPQQIQIAIDTCARERRNHSFWTEYPKIKDTKSMDCMNVLSIDPHNKYIRLFRIGAEYDRHGRHIGSLVYDYRNKQLLYNY